jgi:hypothetical protein
LRQRKGEGLTAESAPRWRLLGRGGRQRGTGVEVAGVVGGVGEVRKVRVKLTTVAACPDDGWRRLASAGSLR